MGQELPQLKSGFRSSEFWTVLLTAAVALIPIFLDAFAGAQAGGKGMLASLGVALAAAVYAHGRSRVKAAHEGVKRAEVRRLERSSDAELSEALEAE